MCHHRASPSEKLILQPALSLCVLEAGNVVNDLAESVNSVPIFVVHDREEALRIVSELYHNPINTIKKAINGEQVISCSMLY